MSDYRQRKKDPKAKAAAASVLAGGGSVRDAAESAGKSERTVWRWKASDPDFLDRVKQAEAAQVAMWNELAELAMGELKRRLLESADGEDTRNLVGIATRAVHHTAAVVDRGVSRSVPVLVLTDADRAEAADALAEMAESADEG